VKTKSLQSAAGFTFVELLVGMSLALMIMTAVLTTYVSLGRNFTRTLGLSSANQPTLENQSRRTITAFTQDVRMAIGISGTPSSSALTLIIPTSSGTTTVAYNYNSSTQKLTRTPGGGTALVLHTNLLTCTFNYYDTSGNPFATYVNYANGIKQVSLTLTSQAGSNTNGTLTPVYEADSSRLMFRNKSLPQ